MSHPVPPTDAAIIQNGATAFLEIVRPDLQAVEDELQQAAASTVHEVGAVGRHVLLAGGKRFRPACVALSSRAISEHVDARRLVAVATAMELVHTATLVHDDVVDNTHVRRGVATANAVFGNGVAVLTGDYLLAKAVSMLASETNMRLIHTLADVTVQMSEGEVLQMVASGDPNLTDEAYFELIRKKTAEFIAGCCRCGAILADASSEEEEALSHYGLNIGMAFQITDDLLDYTGDPALTGKPVGNDLREGRATLPLLLGLRNTSDGHRAMLLSAFGDASLPNHSMSVVVQTLRLARAFDETAAAARVRARMAKDALSVLRPSPYRDALGELADYAVERTR